MFAEVFNSTEYNVRKFILSMKYHFSNSARLNNKISSEHLGRVLSTVILEKAARPFFQRNCRLSEWK